MFVGQSISVSHRGEDYDISVEVLSDGLVAIKCTNTLGGSDRLPPLTAFEAGMLARELNRAAEKADAH